MKVVYPEHRLPSAADFAGIPARRHAVTAVVRDPAKIATPAVTVCEGNVLDPASVTATAAGADAAISAYAPPPDDTAKLVDATRSLVTGLQKGGCPSIPDGRRRGQSATGGRRTTDGRALFSPVWKSIAISYRDSLDVPSARAISTGRISALRP
jgi:hypothetical protein